MATNSELSAEASWRSQRIEFLRPLEEFVNEQGEFELPEDLDELNGTGQRNAWGAKFAASFGTQTPLGFDLDAGINGINYSDTTEPSLVDNRRFRAGATIRLRFSQVDEAHVGVNYSRYEAEDGPQTSRHTYSAEIGYDRQLDAASRVGAEFGYSIVDTEEFGAIARVEGFNGRVTYEIERPDGSLDAEFAALTTQNGTRLNISAGRTYDMPLGNLSARIGAVRPEGGSWTPSGELAWSHNYPEGQITARLSRGVRSTSDDSTAVTTLATLRYGQRISPASSVTFGLTYAIIDEAGEPAVDRASVSATYSQALTREWNLDLGVSYQSREEAGLGRAASESIFLGLSRRFDWQY